MRETSRDGRTIVRTGIPEHWRVPAWHQMAASGLDGLEVRQDLGRLYTSTQRLRRRTSVIRR